MLRFIVLLTVFSLPCAFCGDYLITAPDVFRANVEEDVLVSIFGSDGNGPLTVSVTVTLTTSDGVEVASKTTDVTSGVPKVLTFIVNVADVPSDEEIPTLVVRAVSTHNSLSFNSRAVVLLTTKNQVVFIQTDKPIYTPDQEVKIRVISLNEEMKPTDRNVRLEITTPRGSIIERRDDLSTNTGYITEIFSFSSYPTFGIWTINVYYGRNYEWKSTVEFELKKYVLPTFEVIVEGQSQIIPSDNAIFATVTARYVYNKEVRGKAQVVMSVFKKDEEIKKFAAEAKELNEQGKATFTITPADTDGVNWFDKFEGARLKIEAVVTEQATGDRENTTISAAKFVRQVYTFKRDRTISHYKKGTTFDVKIDLFHSDGTPGVNVPTLIEGLGYNPAGVGTPLTGTADFELLRSSNGLGQVDFRLDVNQNTERIEVTIKTLDNNYPDESNGVYTLTVYPIDSPSGAYLQIRVPAGEIQVIENYEAEVVKSGTVDVFGISYFVIVRGKIVQTYTDLNSNLGAQKTIRIGITKDMAPSARLVIFSFVGDEIVADSILLDIVDKCQSQLIVNIDDDDDTRSPGDVVQFTIIAEPQSRVGLLAVDEAVYFLKDFHRLTKKKMFQRMETLDLGCGPGGGGSSKEIFENAGLIALTSANFGKTSVRQGYECPTESDRRRKRGVSENQKCYKEFEHDADLCSACESGFLHIPGITCVDRIKKFAKRKNIDLPEDYGSPPDHDLLGEVVSAFLFCCEKKEEERNVVAGRNANVDIDIDEDESTVNVRSNFPETWIFEEYEIPDSRQIVIDFSVPDSITNWIVQASSVSAAMGMCVAEEKEIEVSKDVFIQLKMPYSMVRGEQTQIQATLFNYGSREVTGNVYLYGVDGVCSESLPGKRGPKHQLTVPKNDARTTYFNIIPFNVGNPQIEVKAFTDSGNDGIRKQILVVPEGVERYHSKVLLIDPTGSRASEAEDGEVQEPDQPLDNEFPFKPETFTDHENSLQRDTFDIAIVDFNAIPGTEQCFITFFGDVMAPSVSSIIEGLDPGSLLGKPMGCGEQTMMFMSANVYTMLYLDKTAQITAEVEESGFSKVDKSYQRMINYQRTDDGSFSAWGDRRPGSTWLTAYTVKVFYNVIELGRFVDDTVLCNAYNFFETRYMSVTDDQGRFREGNTVVHRDMAGGISGEVMMTAFVVTTLVKYNPGNLVQPVVCDVDYDDKLTKAIAFLEDSFNTLETVYHRTVVAYALNVVGSKFQDDVWNKVKEEASFDPVKGLRHFTMNSKALTVEATSYALLTAVHRNEITYANGMVNWLTEHRDFKRGFSSTSDTAIAFEALATYSSETSTTSVNMRCELSSTSTNTYEEIVEITDATATLSQRRECPTDGLLVIECSGDGVAQAEVEVIYNTQADTAGEECAFFIFAQMIELEADPGSEKLLYRMEVTVKYQLEARGQTDMAIIEVGLFTGFTPVQSTLDNLVASAEYPVERYETSDKKVIFYLEFMLTELTTLRFNVEQTVAMANVQSASVTVYDYYFPEKRCTAFYNPHDDQTELRQACEGDVCVCAAGPCPDCAFAVATHSYEELYNEIACGPQSGIDYVFEVIMQAVDVTNGFITLTATVNTRLKKGRDTFEEVGDDEPSPRFFIIKSSCPGCELFEIGRKYLIMGKDGIPYKDVNVTKYKYLLDRTSYIEKWPKKAENKSRAKELNKFKNAMKNEGCAA